MNSAPSTRPSDDQAARLSIGLPFNPYKRFPGMFIPEPVCKYRGLSPGAKLIYGRLSRYAGEDGAAYPAVPTLADEIGMSETQARGYIRELEQAKFISVDRANRHYRKDGTGGSNNYVFLWHAAFTGDQGERRKMPPPLRKTEGVPLRKTAPLTPAENRTQRESIPRESGKESQSTHDYQPTNRKMRDSQAGGRLQATNTTDSTQTPTQNHSAESVREYSTAELEWMADALNRYGRWSTMSQYMQESAPPAVVRMCLDAADGVPLTEIGQVLRHRCLNGCSPGQSRGPRGWGWFPTVIKNAIRSWREQEAAAKDATSKTHWSQFRTAVDPAMLRSVAAFSTLDQDDLEAIA